MANPFSKGWKYLMANFDSKIDEHADPKVQIQQATDAAKKQFQDIRESASAVIGNQRQLEMRLNKLREDQDNLAAKARQALELSDKAATNGDSGAATEFANTAEIYATQLVSVEQQLEGVAQQHQAASAAAEQAKQAVSQAEAKLREDLASINQLRAQVDQANMQEATNQAMDNLGELAVDGSVPSLDKVRAKIEQRYANAMGANELVSDSYHGRMAEIESAGSDLAARSRLDQIRAEMGGGELTAGSSADKQLEQGTAATADDDLPSADDIEKDIAAETPAESESASADDAVDPEILDEDQRQ